ncbi:NADH-quinone oxidoreductase subunit C [Sulfurospirillum sp. 1612]|uniref:NADH-quinone oxidoreductase subunit C n=1 Tax=Sulfurospirillum sp. 1612 TaxID=3094835 RepID=UPI002F95C45A
MSDILTKLQGLSMEVTQKNERLYKLMVDAHDIMSTLLKLLNEYDYITLDSINCRDDLEEGYFTITYCLLKKTRDHVLMVQTSINRENASLPTLHKIWPQAEILERELHEFFGIDFPGHPTLIDFALEGWNQLPPLRRDFDTLEFVNSLDPFRGQRDDNLDVKVEMKKRREEKKAQKLKEAQEAAKNEEVPSHES